MTTRGGTRQTDYGTNYGLGATSSRTGPRKTVRSGHSGRTCKCAAGITRRKRRSRDVAADEEGSSYQRYPRGDPTNERQQGKSMYQSGPEPPDMVRPPTMMDVLDPDYNRPGITQPELNKLQSNFGPDFERQTFHGQLQDYSGGQNDGSYRAASYAPANDSQPVNESICPGPYCNYPPYDNQATNYAPANDSQQANESMCPGPYCNYPPYDRDVPSDPAGPSNRSCIGPDGALPATDNTLCPAPCTWPPYQDANEPNYGQPAGGLTESGECRNNPYLCPLGGRKSGAANDLGSVGTWAIWNAKNQQQPGDETNPAIYGNANMPRKSAGSQMRDDDGCFGECFGMNAGGQLKDDDGCFGECFGMTRGGQLKDDSEDTNQVIFGGATRMTMMNNQAGYGAASDAKYSRAQSYNAQDQQDSGECNPMVYSNCPFRSSQGRSLRDGDPLANSQWDRPRSAGNAAGGYQPNDETNPSSYGLPDPSRKNGGEMKDNWDCPLSLCKPPDFIIRD